jgi:uncharacterized damage-inducible protein DinB
LTIERFDPPFAADEKTMLVSFLEYHRATLKRKCDGLSPEQLLSRAVPPSSLCLLGLVRHLADVEYAWFREVFAGEEQRYLYGPGDADLDVREADEAEVARAWKTFDEQAVAAGAIIAASDLDALSSRTARRSDDRPTLRWLVVHLIEEYARHNGHADLLREAIDGATGE